MKKHSNVDYGAAKLVETDKGLIRLVDKCLMKLEPLGKGPRVLQKVYKSELEKLYKKGLLCPYDKNINVEMFFAGEKLAIFHNIGQGNPNITSTINDIVNSMGHHDNRMLYLHFKDLYLKIKSIFYDLVKIWLISRVLGSILPLTLFGKKCL